MRLVKQSLLSLNVAWRQNRKCPFRMYHSEKYGPPANFSERDTGIEPASHPWEGCILPVY